MSKLLQFSLFSDGSWLSLLLPFTIVNSMCMHDSVPVNIGVEVIFSYCACMTMKFLWLVS